MGNNGGNWLDFLTKHRNESISGGILGGVAYGNWVFLNVGQYAGLFWEYLIRGIATVIVAVLSAFATAWAKDVYENYKEDKKLKKKEYERRKKTTTNGGNSKAA